MADLGVLVHTSVDDIEVPLTPEGTWRVRAVSGSITEPAIDKNGQEYCMAKLVLKPVAIADVEDVDPTELDKFTEANGFDESTLFYSRYMARAADFKSMGNILKAAGAATKGRDLAEILTNGISGVEFNAEVTHEQDENGEIRVRCNKIFATE